MASDREASRRQFLEFQEALKGRYVLQRELGRGGMGVVYLAWDTALERKVALKILPPAYSSLGQRERFLKEAKIAARLKHPNIVAIHAVDEAGPFVYYVMDFIEGGTLAQWVNALGPVAPGEAARILRDVAWALHHAHGQGVIHRDLKPQNILLEAASGRAMVTDFGIARVLREPLPARRGTTLGTFAYASPEQAAGQAVDARGDIYSLGVVAFAIVTGRLPFTGKPMELLKQHRERPAPALPVLGRNFDPTLAQVVARCLAKDPGDRFQGAEELAEALSLVAELRPALPEPLQGFVEGVHLPRDTMALVGVAGLGGLVVLGSALDTGSWGVAGAAAGFLSVALAAPLVEGLRAARHLLDQGYDESHMVHALADDLERQKHHRKIAPYLGRDRWNRRLRRIAWTGFGFFVLGMAAARLGINLPEKPFVATVFLGGMTAGLAGVALWVRGFFRERLTGEWWLDFWSGRLGKWGVRLAGLGLRPVRRKVLAAEPQPAAQLPDPAWALRGDLLDTLHRTESCVRRGRAWLEASASNPSPSTEDSVRRVLGKLEMLEAMLGKLQSLDAQTTDGGSLTADLQAVIEVCDVVDAVIEGSEWA
jgi:serine/threonine-protein kinase